MFGENKVITAQGGHGGGGMCLTSYMFSEYFTTKLFFLEQETENNTQNSYLVLVFACLSRIETMA